MIKLNFCRITLFAFILFAINSNLQAQTTDTAQIIKIADFKIPQLNSQRTIRILLPAGYATSGKMYPVIYMMDGQNLFKGAADIKSTWGVDSTLNSLPANKQCIIVGIDHAGKDRISEYSPYKTTYGTNDGVAFTRFLVETLKPYIDVHYRTKKEAKFTAIAGSSMGSLLAMYAIDKYPETYGVAGIFSPAFWIAPEIFKLTESQPLNKNQRFYFTCGDNESKQEVVDVMKMDSILRVKGYNTKQLPSAKINVGAIHNETQWRQAFPAFYNWFIRQL